MKQDEKELCGWFIFCPKQQLLLVKDGDRFHIPYSVEPPVQLPADTPIHTVGEILGHPAKACALPLEALTEQNTSFIPTDLRASYDVLPLEEYQCAGKASQILTWDKNSRFCPACGTPTTQTGPITKRCPHCGQEIYPRISPAVIVLIKKEDSVLLVHARNFRGSFKGLVARLPGAWRNTGRMRSPRSDGRNRYPYQKPEVFREPALALSKRYHGGILCGI